MGDPYGPYAPGPGAPPPPVVPHPVVPGPGPAWPGPAVGPPRPDRPAGSRGTRRVLLAVAAAVVVGAVAVGALAATGPGPAGADGRSGPSAAPAAYGPATSTLRPGPAPKPTRTAGAGPTSDPAGTGLVALSAPAAAHPQAADVLTLLDAHFTAINDQDYDAWVATVEPGRAADLPRDAWTRAFRTTRDSDVAVSSIDDADAGVLVDLAFVSEQDVADAPPDLPAPRICWAARWPVADGRIGVPLRGATTRRAC